MSPTFSRNSGPGICPLKVRAFAVTPLPMSTVASSAMIVVSTMFGIGVRVDHERDAVRVAARGRTRNPARMNREQDARREDGDRREKREMPRLLPNETCHQNPHIPGRLARSFPPAARLAQITTVSTGRSYHTAMGRVYRRENMGTHQA